MKLFKKIGMLGMAAMMVFSFAACNRTGGNKSDDNGETNGGNGGETLDGFKGYDESLRVEDTRGLSPEEYTVYNITGTDDYGRTILTADGIEDEDRYVGLFYFLWLGQEQWCRGGIYDMSEITQNGTDLDAFQVDDRTSPANGTGHFWGKPVWGYYNSTDEWVIRKQVEMFCLAGVDFLIFDATNGFIYENVTNVLFKVLLEYQAAGWKVPKIMYYAAGTEGGYMNELKSIYNYCYKDDTYSSLWFAPDGKPIITMYNKYYHSENYGLDLNDPEEKAIYDRFEFRCRQWPTETFEEDGIPWMEFVPDSFYDRQPSHNGWVNVSVAQHVTIRFSDTIGTQGRGYDLDTGFSDHTRYGEDLNYQSQWKTVLDNKEQARFTFITGWNEWVAQKNFDGSQYFVVDTFIPEFSRDLEPSENLGDNGYMLTAKLIRENNFKEAKHYVYPMTTIDITKDDPLWNTVAAKYADFTGDCADRNCTDVRANKRLTLTDTSGRNDIASVQVARDGNYLYFRVETAEDITPYEAGDTNWMNLWIKTRNAKETYLGYDYVIGRRVENGKTSVSHATAGGLKETGMGDVFVSGKVMVVRVKLSDLGLGGANYDIEFKVTDNVQINEEGNYPYLDFYRTGDSAPIGRLNYRYGY